MQTAPDDALQPGEVDLEQEEGPEEPFVADSVPSGRGSGADDHEAREWSWGPFQRRRDGHRYPQE
eukprot:1268940-Alexandrium_andersonii.AAC.1